jgi:hypothetical protein
MIPEATLKALEDRARTPTVTFHGAPVIFDDQTEVLELIAEVRNLHWALTTIREQDTGAWPSFAGEVLRMSTNEATALRERWTQNATTLKESANG